MLVAIDYETADIRGASFEYFREDFRIFSLSCCWRGPDGKLQYWFSTKEKSIRLKLEELAREKHQIVAHNLPYEMGCTQSCYPHIKLNWYADTMRLAQVRDGGGDEFGTPVLNMEQEIAMELGEITDLDMIKIWNKKKGLSLEACAARFLEGDFHNHKAPAHDWLRDTHNIKSKHGQYLHLLPYNLLRDYNNADTLITLLLFENLEQFFTKTYPFDWKKDHFLYFKRAELLTDAYYRGVKIDQERLLTYIKTLESKLTVIHQEFMETFSNDLGKVKLLRKQAYIDKKIPTLKSFRGVCSHLSKLSNGHYDKEWKDFNIGSNKQLEILFCDVLGIKSQFLTPKGSPSFKTTHLHQWGKGGEILKMRKKLLLVLQQCVNVYCASLYDGRVHASVKISGTRTNRVSGGRV